VYELVYDKTSDPPLQQLTPPEYETSGVFIDYTFEELCDRFFEYEITLDSLLLNQLVTNPKELGIKVPRPATLGDHSLEAWQADNQFYSEILDALENSPKINFDALTPQQQREASYIKETLELTLLYEEFFYYESPLKPSTGAQAMLPLSLMDYSFRCVEDVEIYLEVLEDFPRYFDQLLANEQEKINQGLAMPLEAMEDTIEEARAYTGSADTHILNKSFSEMLQMAVEEAREAGRDASDLADLTTKQISDFNNQNVAALEEFVIPAYDTLLKTLESLAQYCKPGTRLFDYPLGREYYTLKMQAQGFAEGPQEAIRTLERSLRENWGIIMSDTEALYLGDQALKAAVEAIGDDPEDFIEFVREQSTAEFAGIRELNYTIKIAPDASPNDYAMAYFLIPPVDNPQQNTIVFFPRNISDEVDLYCTVAHEAYPGHMYHFFAYSIEEPSNISKILGSSAFIEGWAMYSQGFAMGYLDVEPNIVEAYNAYDRFAYGLQARVDLGINFQGWGVEETARYLSNWGFDSAAQAIFDTSLKQPVAYLPYGLGLVKFRDMRIQAEKELGGGFDPIAYHQMLTGLGPVPFDMLDTEMQAWLREQSSNPASV